MIIDWQQVGMLLIKHLGTAQRASKATGCSKQLIESLDNGSLPEPRFSAGVKLLDALHDAAPDDARSCVLSGSVFFERICRRDAQL